MKVQIELDDLSRKTLVRIANETKDPDVLEELSKSKSTKVLAAVAGNKATDKVIVSSLYFHKNKEVQMAASKALQANASEVYASENTSSSN